MEVNFVTSAALGCVRLHILVILPADSKKEHFAKFLDVLPIEDRRNGKEEIRNEDLKEWIKKVHKQRGVCIAAHVESENGIRQGFRQTAKSVMKLYNLDEASAKRGEVEICEALKNFIFDVGFDALEIKKPDDKHHYKWVEPDGRKRQVSVVLGLDAHCIEEYGRKERVTLMKMTSPNINGLRDALRWPKTRVRFPSDLKEPPSPRLLGMAISGGDQAFFEDVRIGFSENLNCIIGARGSGKSTVVEALRYVMGYNRTLSDLDVDNKLSPRILSLQNATLTGSQIRLYYQREDNAVRVLEATYDQKQPYATRVFDEEGKPVPVGDVERSGDYPLRLYGWSEIETLGRDQARQREIIDRMIPDLKEAIEERSNLRKELEKNRELVSSKITSMQGLVDKNQGEIFHYAEYVSDFQELNKAEVKSSFEEIDLLQSKKRVLGTVKENVSVLIETLEDLEPIVLTAGVEKIVPKGDNELAKWWQREQIKDKEIAQAEQLCAGEIAKMKQRLRQLENSLNSKIDGLSTKIEDEYEKLREAFSGQPDKQRIADLRNNAKKRLERVGRIRDAYVEAWRELKSLLGQRASIGKRLKKAQSAVTGVRAAMIHTVQAKLDKFMSENLRVGIKMAPDRDRDQFAGKLRDFLRAPHKRTRPRLLAVVPECYNPVDFGNVLLERKFQELIGKHILLGGTKTEIDADDVDHLTETKDWYEHREDGDINVLLDKGNRLLAILKLQEVPWDDRTAILLNDRSVDELSPGQRSSAMLPLIALAEECPLVIDQPEDNLDNRLVGNVLVDILAELKEHRQIIVCTHNPNILVSGDAEQVIVLDAESDKKGKMINSGSVDNDDIVETVIDLMEGGYEAFEARRARYGL